MQHSKWKVLSRQDVSPSKWFPIFKDEVQLPDGSTTEYYRSQLADVAMVVPVTVDHELIFVRQYKHGVGEVCLEFPAGRVEVGHTPEQTAIKELQEETGIVIGTEQLLPLAELWTEPSKSSVRVSGFLARDVVVSGEQNLEVTEQIEVVKVPVDQVSSLLKSGELHASDTVALLLWAKEKWPEFF